MNVKRKTERESETERERESKREALGFMVILFHLHLFFKLFHLTS